MHTLARRYGLSADALGRHSRNHLPAQLRAKLIAGPDLAIDLDRLRETESQSLLVHLVSLRARLFHSLDVAEENGDGHMLATLSSQIHRNLEVTGRLLGALGIGSSVTNNILIAPQYVEMRHAFLAALAPFPEARIAVAAALHGMEHKAAEAIRADARQFAGASPKPAPLAIEHAPQPLPPPPC